MKKFLPLILGLVGLMAGAGAGWALRPADEPPMLATLTSRFAPPPAGAETQRLPNQFVVPLLEGGRVRAMVVLSLALEVSAGEGATVLRQEARLRAILLQVLFDYANLGGFEGVFTSGEALLTLRRTLLEAARADLGDIVHDVLITEILRQD